MFVVSVLDPGGHWLIWALLCYVNSNVFKHFSQTLGALGIRPNLPLEGMVELLLKNDRR